MVCMCVLWREHPKAQMKVVLEKLGIQPATPCLQGIELIHYTMAYQGYFWHHKVSLMSRCIMMQESTMLKSCFGLASYM